MAAAAKRLGLEVIESGDLVPGTPPSGTGGSTPELAARLFGDGISEGDSGVVAVPAGAMIYEVTRRERFDPAAFAAAVPELRQELEIQRRETLRQATIAELRRRRSIEVNDSLIERINR